MSKHILFIEARTVQVFEMEYVARLLGEVLGFQGL